MPSPPLECAASAAWVDRFKCGQNVRRLGRKTGQNVPRLRRASAVRRRDLSHGHHRETRRRSESAADLAGPGRGVRVRRELRIGETVRADARADTPGRRRLSLRAWGGSAGGFLPRRADARRRDRGVATAVGLSDDAGPLAARLRGSGVGSETRDVSAPARTRVPRPRRRAAGHSPRQSQSGRGARLLLRSRQPRRLSRVRGALGLHAAADAAAPPAGKR